MSVSTARKPGFGFSPSRAGRSFGLAAILLVLGCQGLQNANAIGDTRTLSLHHIHTGEDLTVTFKRNGRYDDEALQRLNWFLRDWRRDEQINMDPQLFDLLWELHREVAAKELIHVIGGYRAPETNAMLRVRSSGVALYSQHMSGNAMDFFIPGVPVEELRVAALRLQSGGVGYYPATGSRFVHLDTGNVRHWPRMTREELVRVFPDGRTVHIPADGEPLPGYALALADLERGVTHRPTTAQPKFNLFAKLFGVHDDEEASTTSNRRPAAPAARLAHTITPEANNTAPRPPSRAASSEVATAPVVQPAPRPQAVSADPITTASILSPWPTPQRNDRVSPEIALAYAARIESTPQTALLVAPPIAAAASVEPKHSAPAAQDITSIVPPKTARPRLDNPWLHAVVLAPSMYQFMTSTQFNPPDPRQLRSFMHKPASTVMMTFSADPYRGMTANAFSGKAVVFVATVTFGMRTAALR